MLLQVGESILHFDDTLPASPACKQLATRASSQSQTLITGHSMFHNYVSSNNLVVEVDTNSKSTQTFLTGDTTILFIDGYIIIE